MGELRKNGVVSNEDLTPALRAHKAAVEKPRVRGLMKPMEGHEYDMNINSYCRIELAAVVAYLLLDDGSRMLACAFISI